MTEASGAVLPWTLGLTGGIGSGKSAASQWFADQDITVVDADVVAREVVEPGQPALVEIVNKFGEQVLQANGWLDRAALRERVFADPAARTQLEAITHPRIRGAMVQQLQQAHSAYVVLVSPLLLQTSQRDLVQRVLLIDVPESLQLQRASARDAQTAEAISRIMAAQLPRQQRLAQADDVVDNSGTLADLYRQLLPLHQHYLQRALDGGSGGNSPT